MWKQLIIATLAALGLFLIFSLAEHKATGGVGYSGCEEFIYYLPYLALCAWVGFSVETD